MSARLENHITYRYMCCDADNARLRLSPIYHAGDSFSLALSISTGL